MTTPMQPAGARNSSWNPVTNSDGKTGYMELLFPWQTTGQGLFRIDEDGNVTCNSINQAGGAIGIEPTGNAATDTANLTAALAALQALSNAAGTIVLGEGQFTWNGPFTVFSGLRIYGQGRLATTVTCTSSTSTMLFNMQPTGTYVEAVEIAYLGLSCTGVDIFGGANISRCEVHHCDLTQNSAGNAIWNAPLCTQMIECRFYSNREITSTSSRTVPMWYLTGNGILVNQNKWFNENLFNNGPDSSQYWYQLIYTGNAANAGFRGNSWNNVSAEVPAGGLINCQSCTGTEVDQVYIWDLAANTVEQSLFYFNIGPSAVTGCRSTSITNCARMGGSSFASSTVSDIQLDSHCDQTTIDAYSLNGGGSGITIDLGNSTNISLLGMADGNYTLRNFLTATWADQNGAVWQTEDNALPGDMGFQGWAFDPAVISASTALTTAGVGYLIKVPIRYQRSITGIAVYLGTGQSGTANENFAFLLNSSGTYLGHSLDQTTAWDGSAGLISMPLTVGTTTVASGSNGGEISTIASWSAPSAGVLDAANPQAAGFPSSGSLYVQTSSTVALIAYTGTTTSSFTGCTYISGSATGTVATSGIIALASGANNAPFTVSPPFAYVALIFNGTTGPSMGRGSSLTANLTEGKSSAATYRWATNTTGLVLPKSLTLTNNGGFATTYWAALY